jgi:tetratricopeptide (TPR) repeat protein
MPYVKVVCPSCGGEIQLDNTKEFGYCLHCGTKVILENAVQKIELVNQPKVENLLTLGLEAINNLDYQEALTYFNRVLEITDDNWIATFYKGLARARTVPVKTYPIIPLLRATAKALTLAPNVEGIDIPRTKNTMLFHLTRFLTGVRETVNLSKFNRFEDIDTYNIYYLNFVQIVDAYEYCLTLVNPESKQDFINIYSNILWHISALTAHKLLSNERRVGIPKATREALYEKYKKYSALLLEISPSSKIPEFNRKNIEGGRVK